MSRKPRKKSESQIYHVILRGNNRQSIFFNDADRFFIINRIQKYSEQTNIELYAYCLMDNHIHLLVGKANPNLSKFVQKLATSYAMYFNRKYDRCGHLFQGRFKSEPVETEDYFKTVFRYILQTPEKAHICKFFQYKWSSCQFVMNETTDTFINLEYVFAIFQSKNSLKKFLHAENTDSCMEYENVPVMSDTLCSKIIKEKLKLDYPSQIKTQTQEKMYKSLRYLKQIGINITQLSRITEIPRHIVAQA